MLCWLGFIKPCQNSGFLRCFHYLYFDPISRRGAFDRRDMPLWSIYLSHVLYPCFQGLSNRIKTEVRAPVQRFGLLVPFSLTVHLMQNGNQGSLSARNLPNKGSIGTLEVLWMGCLHSKYFPFSTPLDSWEYLAGGFWKTCMCNHFPKNPGEYILVNIRGPGLTQMPWDLPNEN